MSLSESPQMSLSGFPLKGSEYLLQVQMTQLQLFLLRFHRQALLSASRFPLSMTPFQTLPLQRIP